MSLTPENELAVRRAIGEKLAGVAGIGFVLPAPLYFTERADFWANLSPKLTQKDIETTAIEFCVVYPLIFEDDPKQGGLDEPLIYFTYELYLFQERNFKRKDESVGADAFDKKLLKTHTDFIALWLNVRAAFSGKQYLTALDEAVFAVRQTNSLTQSEFINNDAECEFIPGVKGFEVKLHLKAKILLRDC